VNSFRIGQEDPLPVPRPGRRGLVFGDDPGLASRQGSACYNEGVNTLEISQILPGILPDFPEISLVYLFGSQAIGKTGPMSDFDLAIFIDPSEEDDAIQARFQHALVLALHTRRVDVVLLKRARLSSRIKIIANGKLIYKRDTFTQVEFEAQVLDDMAITFPCCGPNVNKFSKEMAMPNEFSGIERRLDELVKKVVSEEKQGVNDRCGSAPGEYTQGEEDLPHLSLAYF